MKKSDFSRRKFIKHNTLAGFGAALVLGGINGCGVDRGQSENVASGDKEIKTIGGMPLEELRERYRKDLFDQFLPSMDSFVVDHEYGGFMCTVDIRSGEQLSTNKRAWFEGRGIWVYSFLYNNFEKNPQFLEIARKSKDFILKHQPSDDSFWIASFTREGDPLSGPGDIYGNLFIAEGLAEYAKASGERQYLVLAKEIMFKALARYDQPDYGFPISYGPAAAPRIKGPRVLGHWMVFLRLATQLLEHEADPEIEALAKRCVDAVMDYHLNSEYKILNSGLNHDLTLPNNEWAQFSEIGHGIETLWMVMFEAARLKDAELFHRASDSFKRHVRVATDAVYGGCFHSLENVDEYKWRVNKVLWLQEEILIGALFLIEHTDDPWAQQCFAETDAYVREKFVRPDYAFWIPNGDRKIAEYNMKRAEHYHLPRHLMVNLLAIDRMIERGGKASGLFS